mmetsp:Transcript_13319/g.17457  ORF Transcript_13319/g.17457 Transcript_13319/m.17457 type:complete len:167 (+) Transcript_13319:46-546(+)
MIRARRVPPLLSRILGDGIYSVMLLTGEGELLGDASTERSKKQHEGENIEDDIEEEQLDVASVGALISEVAADYARAGRELLPQDRQRRNELDCLIVESGEGKFGRRHLIGVACCVTVQNDIYYIAAMADPDVTGYGLLRARLMALEGYVRESLNQIVGNGHPSQM